jgi:DNA-binding response OmpR family regulator
MKRRATLGNDYRFWEEEPVPKNKRILLVDDDPEIIESLRSVLEGKGYQVMVARDGNQGLALAEREMPDLLILDMMMPKKSGFLVLERLKGKDAKTRKMPTIMITANEGGRHRAYAEMLGVDEYIRKPFALDKLLLSVDRLVGGESDESDAK